jgi:hypothetical protein
MEGQTMTRIEKQCQNIAGNRFKRAVYQGPKGLRRSLSLFIDRVMNGFPVHAGENNEG